MSALADLQARFLAGVIDGDEAALGDLEDDARFPARQRLAIYANAYRQRLVEALGGVYEHCRSQAGEDRFDAWALAYVEANRPHSSVLRDYGRDFPEWLAAHEATPEVGVLAGVAMIDRGLRDAFDAADAPPIGRGALAALGDADWAALQPRWAPAFGVARVEAAAIPRWRGEAPPPAPATAVRVAFWRDDAQTLFRSLGEAEAALLAALDAGQPFAVACIASGLDVEAAVRLLLDWLDAGWIVGLAHAPSTATPHPEPLA